MSSRALKTKYVLECPKCGFSATKDDLPISRCPKCGEYSLTPIKPPPGPLLTYSEVVAEYNRRHADEPMSRALACRTETAVIDRIIQRIVSAGQASLLGITIHADIFDPLPHIRRRDCVGQIRLF